jgi:hypothetical protein
MQDAASKFRFKSYNNNNNYLFTAIGLLPGGSGYLSLSLLLNHLL